MNEDYKGFYGTYSVFNDRYSIFSTFEKPKMEGFGEFDLVRGSSEANANERATEEAPETGYVTNEIVEVTSSSRTGHKQRHSRYQIQELEKFFKENPHPDEEQRLDIGRKLNLEENQVKFWFQNRRTHLKTETHRHGNMLLKQENEKLRLENVALEEAYQNMICKKCVELALQVDRSNIKHNLVIENARLKEELSRLTSNIAAESLTVVSNNPPLLKASRSEIGMATGSNINIPEKTEGYLELASSAMEELMKLGHVNAPLWKQNLDTGGETLNFGEYVRSFPPLLGTKPLRFVSEASRATGVVSLRSLDLVEALLDADRWKEMFAGMIESSATLEVISEGIGGSRNGVLQLMQAEIQLISPSLSARVVKFIRFCKQQAEGVWVVVDLSVDAGQREEVMCRRLPSGCIMHDMPNGFSKVTWVEHTEYDEHTIHHQYRGLLSSGLGFGAQKWICALLRHCEWLRALSSPNYHQLDQTTRTCLKGLARRMTSIFCAGVCLTGGQRWNLVSNEPRIMTRRSMNGPGEPSGTILSAAISVWIPSTHRRLFDLLLNKDLRCMWDVLCHANATANVVYFPTTHDDNNPNSISLLNSNATDENPVMVLQETASDMTGSLIVYAPVDLPTISVMMNTGDTSSAALLPSGLYIVPGSGELGLPGGERGSMVTVGFQIFLQDLVTPNLIPTDAISTVNNLVSRTVLGIKEIVRSTR